MWNGKDVRRVGQETWLPGWVHSKLRFIYDDRSEILRHFPDLDTGNALVQVKAAPNEQTHDFVTIEQASYNTSKYLADMKIPVLVVWEFQDKKFHAQWVQLITPVLPNNDRSDANGSHTPMFKINKNELRPAKDFINQV
jgi:hypothetical protein